jgi:hypothetical protein
MRGTHCAKFNGNLCASTAYLRIISPSREIKALLYHPYNPEQYTKMEYLTDQPHPLKKFSSKTTSAIFS